MDTTNVTMDLSRDVLFDELGLIRLRDSYMLTHEVSPQERFAFIAKTFSAGDAKLSQRLYDYMSKHWLSVSSPQLSFGRTKLGLPIACFLPYLPDTTRGLIDTWAEVSELSVIGGGIGLGVGIRQPDEKSVGIIPHLRTYDASCTAYKQGQTRRGSYAAYLNLNHPEIIQFLNTRKATGDYNYKLINIHNAVNIPDDFMKRVLVISALFPFLKANDESGVVARALELVKEGHIAATVAINTVEDIKCLVETLDLWNLVDPHTGEVKKTISAKKLWANILETRAETGEPYLHFIDTANKSLPEFQKKLGLSIKQSNLCVVGETMVLTRDGNKPIRELVNRSVQVWNGNEYSEVTVMQTGIRQSLVKVWFSDASYLVCTPYHKFLVLDRLLCFADHKRVQARNLYIGFYVWKIDSNLNRTIVSVVKLQSLTRTDNTYCFNEPRNQTGVFNGLLTGNCSEIALPTDEHRTAVCCLSSLNLDYFDEWSEHAMFYKDVATYLDNVLQYFIDNAPKTVGRAIYSASRERAIGIGALGFHSYLQSKSVAIESMQAYNINTKIFKTISKHLTQVNLLLGSERGEAPDCAGTGRRFSHMMAIAPNATSSIIMGNTSPSCEPFRANIYKQDTLSGSHLNVNKHLRKILEQRVTDPEHLRDLYNAIKITDGSVQHISVLSEHEKKVFKCWPEINQMALIRLAAARQRYVDQSQSVSLFFDPRASKPYVHKIHLEAWKMGLKTLYYYRSRKVMDVDKITQNPTQQTELPGTPPKAGRDPHPMIDDGYAMAEPSCTMCEG